MMDRCDVANDHFCEQFNVRIETRFLEVFIIYLILNFNH